MFIDRWTDKEDVVSINIHKLKIDVLYLYMESGSFQCIWRFSLNLTVFIAGMLLRPHNVSMNNLLKISHWNMKDYLKTVQLRTITVSSEYEWPECQTLAAGSGRDMEESLTRARSEALWPWKLTCCLPLHL